MASSQKIHCEDCGKNVQADKYEVHTQSKCPRRTVTCQHCAKKFHLNEKEEHENSCSQYPLRCPSNCGCNAIPREKMEEHIKEYCELTRTSCPLAGLGCSYENSRELVISHVEAEATTHFKQIVFAICEVKRELHQTVEEVRSQMQAFIDSDRRRITHTERKMASLSRRIDELAERIPPQIAPLKESLVWKITDISNKITRCQSADSPFFSSGKFGYKLKAKMRFHQDTMSLYVVICHGEYDDILPWPFQQTVKFEIISRTKKNYSVDIKPHNCQEFQQPSSDCNKAYGYNDLLTIEGVRSSFVVKDTLYVKIKVSKYSL